MVCQRVAQVTTLVTFPLPAEAMAPSLLLACMGWGRRDGASWFPPLETAVFSQILQWCHHGPFPPGTHSLNKYLLSSHSTVSTEQVYLKGSCALHHPVYALIR